MRRFRKTAIYAGVFVSMVTGLYLMMVLFATIPNHAIQKNMLSSARRQMTEDLYDIPESGVFQGVADNYADQVWLSISWYMGQEDPFQAVLEANYFDGEQFGEAAGLQRAIVTGAEPNRSYTRYWHGTAALVRFAHLFTDIQGIRWLGTGALFLLIFVTVRELFRGGYRDPMMCLLLSLFLVQIWNAGLSVEYLPCFLVCFSLCPLYLKLERRGDRYLPLLSMAGGILTAFFDFLTVETVTILVPLILVLTVRSMDGRITNKAETARLLLGCLLWWGVGYAGTFLAKWLAVGLISGQGQILSSMDFAGVRVNGMVVIDGKYQKPGIWRSIGANLSVLFGGAGRSGYGEIIVGMILLGMLVYGLIRWHHTGRRWARGSGFLLGLGLVVIVRYSVLTNHSYIHAFFTYRALVSTILALLMVLMLNLRPRKPRRRRI